MGRGSSDSAVDIRTRATGDDRNALGYTPDEEAFFQRLRRYESRVALSRAATPGKQRWALGMMRSLCTDLKRGEAAGEISIDPALAETIAFWSQPKVYEQIDDALCERFTRELPILREALDPVIDAVIARKDAWREEQMRARPPTRENRLERLQQEVRFRTRERFGLGHITRSLKISVTPAAGREPFKIEAEPGTLSDPTAVSFTRLGLTEEMTPAAALALAQALTAAAARSLGLSRDEAAAFVRMP